METLEVRLGLARRGGGATRTGTGRGAWRRCPAAAASATSSTRCHKGTHTTTPYTLRNTTALDEKNMQSLLTMAMLENDSCSVYVY